MTSLARSTGEAGALFDLSGTVATNATWAEDIYFTEAGAPFDISGLDWKLTFRRNRENTSADITLSSAAGTITVAPDDNGHQRILRIGVAAGALNACEGDYIADLASKDGAGAVLLWAHGTISFRPNPVTF
jgi:hypothetical protein